MWRYLTVRIEMISAKVHGRKFGQGWQISACSGPDSAPMNASGSRDLTSPPSLRLRTTWQTRDGKWERQREIEAA